MLDFTDYVHLVVGKADVLMFTDFVEYTVLWKQELSSRGVRLLIKDRKNVIDA